MGKPPAKPFQKGNQLAKGHGRPPVPDDLRKGRKLTKVKIEEILNRFMNLGEDEAKPSGLTKLEKLVYTILDKAIREGDQKRLDFILDRLIGKVTTNVDIALPRPTIIKRPSGEIVELGAVLEHKEDDE